MEIPVQCRIARLFRQRIEDIFDPDAEA